MNGRAVVFVGCDGALVNQWNDVLMGQRLLTWCYFALELSRARDLLSGDLVQSFPGLTGTRMHQAMNLSDHQDKYAYDTVANIEADKPYMHPKKYRR
jgi:hypothetical protein